MGTCIRAHKNGDRGIAEGAKTKETLPNCLSQAEKCAVAIHQPCSWLSQCLEQTSKALCPAMSRVDELEKQIAQPKAGSKVRSHALQRFELNHVLLSASDHISHSV